MAMSKAGGTGDPRARFLKSQDVNDLQSFQVVAVGAKTLWHSANHMPFQHWMHGPRAVVKLVHGPTSHCSVTCDVVETWFQC